jgi:hypothetical protein
MFSHVAQMTGITLLDNGNWRVDFWICPRASLETLAASVEDDLELTDLQVHGVELEHDDDGLSMIMDESLSDGFAIHEANPEGEGLEGEARTQWESAELTSQLLTAVVENNLLGIWPDEDAS